MIKMKVINKIILLAAALIIPMAACDTDELHDRNINPQALNEVPMEFLFTAAQLGSAAGGSADLRTRCRGTPRARAPGATTSRRSSESASEKRW